MDFGSALRILLRRWIIVLLGMVVTGGAVFYLSTTAPPRYQATGRMLLLLPADARGTEEPGSPFLYLPNGLSVLAQIVSVAPDSKDFHRDLMDQGLSSAYDIGVDPSSPTITVSVTGEDPDNVIATRDALVRGLQAELLQVQEEEGTPERQTAHTRVYAVEETPTQVAGNRTRSMLAVAAAGGLLTLVAVFGIDRLLEIRKGRARRAVSREEADTPRDTSPLEAAGSLKEK